MSLKQKEDKRKTLAYNLKFYATAANQLNHNSSQNEKSNRIDVMRSTFKSFTKILTKLETEVDYDVEPDREENMIIENEYVRAVSKLQAMRIEIATITHAIRLNQYLSRDEPHSFRYSHIRRQIR